MPQTKKAGHRTRVHSHDTNTISKDWILSMKGAVTAYEYRGVLFPSPGKVRCNGNPNCEEAQALLRNPPFSGLERPISPTFLGRVNDMFGWIFKPSNVPPSAKLTAWDKR